MHVIRLLCAHIYFFLHMALSTSKRVEILAQMATDLNEQHGSSVTENPDLGGLETEHPSPERLPSGASVPDFEPRPYVLLSLFFASNLWTILATVIPVLIKNGWPDLGPYTEWYNGKDIIRFLEPVISLPLHVAILVESGLFTRPQVPYATLVVFFLFAALYQQGACYHSSATMFKHTVDTFMDGTVCAPLPLESSPLVLPLSFSIHRNV